MRSPRAAGQQPRPAFAAVLGKRLQQLRKARGLSQPELARVLETSDTTICRYERGRCMPPHAVLRQLVKFYNVTWDELLKD